MLQKKIHSQKGKLTFHSLTRDRLHIFTHVSIFACVKPCLVTTFLLSSCIPSCKPNKTSLLPVSLGQFLLFRGILGQFLPVVVEVGAKK